MPGSAGFEKSREALTTADAHRHDAKSLALALGFAQQLANHPRSRHPEGVADLHFLGPTARDHAAAIDAERFDAELLRGPRVILLVERMQNPIAHPN
jgi:hypothetical protein